MGCSTSKYIDRFICKNLIAKMMNKYYYLETLNDVDIFATISRAGVDAKLQAVRALGAAIVARDVILSQVAPFATVLDIHPRSQEVDVFIIKFDLSQPSVCHWALSTAGVADVVRRALAIDCDRLTCVTGNSDYDLRGRHRLDALTHIYMLSKSARQVFNWVTTFGDHYAAMHDQCLKILVNAKWEMVLCSQKPRPE